MSGNVPAIRFAGFTEPWEQRELGDIAGGFEYGLNAAATEYDGVNKYLRITDIDDDTHEFRPDDLTSPQANLEASTNYLLEEGDLLFARTGASVGKTYLYRPFDGNVYFAGFLIRAHIGNEADPEFMFQSTLTERYRRYIAITSQRSGQPGVNAQEYAEFEMPLPSLLEQRVIGSLLRSLDNLITLHQRKHDQLATLKKSLLEKMFPKPGSDVPELRFAGFTEPWEQRKLGDIVGTTYGGGTPSTSVDDYWNGELPWIQSSNVEEGELFEIQIPKAITRRGLAESAAMEVPADSIAVVTHVGVGKLVYLPFSYSTSQDFVSLSDVTVDAGFLCYALFRKLNSELHIVQGSAIKGITKDELLSKEISVPSSGEQEAIAVLLRSLDNLITLHQRKHDQLATLKKSLLEKMFV